jgi:hypothetical protein
MSSQVEDPELCMSLHSVLNPQKMHQKRRRGQIRQRTPCSTAQVGTTARVNAVYHMPMNSMIYVRADEGGKKTMRRKTLGNATLYFWGVR